MRVEQRLDQSLAVRYGEQYVPIHKCDTSEKPTPAVPAKVPKLAKRRTRSSNWNRNFDVSTGPKLWQAMKASGSRRQEE